MLRSLLQGIFGMNSTGNSSTASTPPAPGARPPAPTSANSQAQIKSGNLEDNKNSSRTIFLMNDTSPLPVADAKSLDTDDFDLIHGLAGMQTSPHVYRYNLEVNKPLLTLDRCKWLYPSIEDVSKVRLLLSRLPIVDNQSSTSTLPPSCVDSILDFAGYIASFKTETSGISSVRDSCDRQICTRPIRSPLEYPLRRVTFDIVSRDQGWSGEDPATRGTYTASYTWFQAQLYQGEKPGATETCLPCDRKPWEELVSDTNHKILKNRQSAGRSRHVIILDEDHPIVEEARRGNFVAIYAGACFGGWTNHVESITILLSVAT
ncbi:MAG: hypothetical protein M1814_005359 [Vezdaea aestivalis]|nr:MAG: hypothetical protein M1814_005359 [Vezdaea aestivalis]